MCLFASSIACLTFRTTKESDSRHAFGHRVGVCILGVLHKNHAKAPFLSVFVRNPSNNSLYMATLRHTLLSFGRPLRSGWEGPSGDLQSRGSNKIGYACPWPTDKSRPPNPNNSKSSLSQMEERKHRWCPA